GGGELPPVRVNVIRRARVDVSHAGLLGPRRYREQPVARGRGARAGAHRVRQVERDDARLGGRGGGPERDTLPVVVRPLVHYRRRRQAPQRRQGASTGQGGLGLLGRARRQRPHAGQGGGAVTRLGGGQRADAAQGGGPGYRAGRGQGTHAG